MFCFVLFNDALTYVATEKESQLGAMNLTPMLRNDPSTELENAANLRAQRRADLTVTKPEQLFRTQRAKVSQSFVDSCMR